MREGDVEDARGSPLSPARTVPSWSCRTLLVLVCIVVVAIIAGAFVTLGGGDEHRMGVGVFLSRVARRLEASGRGLGSGGSGGAGSGVGNSESGDGGSTPTPSRAPLRGTLSDPDPIHIAITLCGNPNEVEQDHYGLLVVKSILMSKAHSPGAERHYVFHILINISEEELFNTTRLNYETYRAMRRQQAAGLISFHVYHITQLDRAVQAALGPTNPNLAVPHHIFKNCAASRIKLPFLLGGLVDRVLYLDWDSVALCDLVRLWDMWKSPRVTQHPNAIIGFAHNDPSGVSDRDTYRIWNLTRPPQGSINSGVMLMHLGRMHANDRTLTRAFWSATRDVIAEKVNITGNAETDYWSTLKAFPLGDQDILNALFSSPSTSPWLFILPPASNVCIDPPFLEEMDGHTTVRPDFTDRPPPCIIHYCGNRLFPTSRGAQALPLEDPTQATFMYFKYWALEKPMEPPGVVPRR